MSETVLGCVGGWARGRVGAWMHDCPGAWSRGCVDRLLRVVEWCMRERILYVNGNACERASVC